MDRSVLQEGSKLYIQGNYQEALAYFLSLPENCGADPVETAYYIGLCYSKLKRYDDALLYLEQVVTAHKNDEDEDEKDRVLQCRYLLAILYSLSGRKKLADFELKKLLETGYRKSSVYASLAFLAWEAGDRDGSFEYYEKALKEEGENPTALNGYGYVLACEGEELTKALSLCKKALDIAPENAAFLDSLGWVYYHMGLFDEALKYLKKAEKNYPENQLIKEHIKEVEGAKE